jgi:hypothetical protein
MQLLVYFAKLTSLLYYSSFAIVKGLTINSSHKHADTQWEARIKALVPHGELTIIKNKNC